MSQRLDQLTKQISPRQVNGPPIALLKDQVVLITGGAQGQREVTIYGCGNDLLILIYLGLGAATATLFAQYGALIAISDVDETKSQGLVKHLRETGAQAESFSGDLLDPSYPETLVKQVFAKFGRINCLINNAGRFDILICTKQS